VRALEQFKALHQLRVVIAFPPRDGEYGCDDPSAGHKTDQ
jgi:hypothetical protein